MLALFGYLTHKLNGLRVFCPINMYWKYECFFGRVFFLLHVHACRLFGCDCSRLWQLAVFKLLVEVPQEGVNNVDSLARASYVDRKSVHP